MVFPILFPIMASIFKRQGASPYYFCSYRGSDGRWRKKTTKQTDRRKALEFARKMEDAEAAALNKTLTTQHARKVLDELLLRVGDEPLVVYTVRDWFSERLKVKGESRASSTAERYRKPVDDFLDHLDSRADLPLKAATPNDILTFRNAQRKAGRAAATVNFAHKAIASLFEAARRQGFIDTNPAHAVDYLPTHSEEVEKQTFTADEVAALVANAGSKDWEGVILCGYYTGLRLKDCLGLTWGLVDLQEGVIRVKPRKTARTGKTLTIPLHSVFKNFLISHDAAKGADDPVFPSLHKLSTGGNRGASRRFQSIMDRAGVAAGVLREKAGDAGRRVQARTFSSLRHTNVTAHSKAGTQVEVRQMLVGHASKKQNLHYTHADMNQLRKAVRKLPSVKKK